MQLHITWLGQPKDIKTKFGMKQKNSIKATEYGDKYLDFWVTSQTKNWKTGDAVDVLEVKEREYNGKKYYDIFMPKADHPGVNAELQKTLEGMRYELTQIKLSLVELCGMKRIGTLRMVENPDREMKSHELPEYTVDEEFDGLDDPKNQPSS